MYGTISNYEGKPTLVVKEEKKNLPRTVSLIVTVFVLLCVVIYCLCSNHASLPLSSHLLSATQTIRIKFSMDKITQDLIPGTPQWQTFHDDLMRNAGYDPISLRDNPYATVSFVAYDTLSAYESTKGSSMKRKS